MNKTASYRRLIQFFLQGLLVIAPIAITIWAIAAAFSFVDGISPKIPNRVFAGYYPLYLPLMKGTNYE